jgi:two-component sensor histidine kinase
MFEILKKSIDSLNEGDQKKAKNLSLLILISFVAYTVTLFISFFLNTGDNGKIGEVALIACILLIVPFALLRRGYLRVSTMILVLIGIGSLITFSTLGQGIRDISILGFPILFILASLTLDRVFFRLCVGLTVAAVSWLAIGEANGWFFTQPFFDPSNWLHLTLVTILLLMAAIASDLLATNIRKNLEQARYEIEQRKQAEEKIRNLLAEKEMILTEVHHRVKNNMNTMGALLRLQSNTQGSPETKNFLEDAAGRLNSMMVLYDKLYRSDNFGKLSLKVYVPSLIEEIVSIFPRSVKTELQIEDILIDIKLLSSLGILLNELITNSMKHAFNNSDSGLITVSASRKDNVIAVLYGDNGIGLPESVTLESSTGFGMQLIGFLLHQINGTIRIERNHGTRFIIEFED